MIKVSVVIPSFKDVLLHKTIDSLLENSELANQLEIVVCLDGYWPEIPVRDDPRIHLIHVGKNSGMREAINTAVRLSKGEYIMRTDEHCVFDKGFDVKLTERFKDDWIVYPIRYYLDPVKWEVMDLPPNVYNKLQIDYGHHKFSGFNWKAREDERRDKMIDESMACQGSCWIMKRSLWDKLGELQTEGYGPQNQDSVEMVFKLWKLGGRLMVNKNTWYAHKHRDFPRTHKWQNQTKLVQEQYQYVLDLWGPYYQEIKQKWNV